MSISKIIREGSSFNNSNEEVELVSFSEPDEINAQTFIKYNGVVLDATDTDAARVILKRLRTFDLNNIYLKPVFLISHEGVKDASLLALSDGEIDPAVMSKIGYRMKNLQDRISRLELIKTESFEMYVMMKMLRFLYTREMVMEPVLDSCSRVGYSFPLVSVNFDREDQHRVFSIIDMAEHETLIEGTFVDRIHLCDKCFSGFLNFREACPKCGGPNLKTEDLVHHFTCAYVGPESDFRKQEGADMICPKCGRLVRHIGVDYDKPATLNFCNTCNEKFQDPKVRAFCFNCKNDTLVENLIEKDVKSYRLTSKGEHAAIYGVTISMKDVIRIPGLVDMGIFNKYIEYEVERFKRVARNGCVAHLHFVNFYDLYVRGVTREKIFPEIIEIIKGSIRPSDMISYLDEATLLFFFTDTPLEAASIPVERLKANLLKLIHDNFTGFEPKIETEIVPISGEFSLDAFVGKIAPP
ncbi:MAG: hypothetical protein HZA20_09620 [Nitrospirae bacterium]|nr:hypothetical protein [Nitrospirota bacterium]